MTRSITRRAGVMGGEPCIDGTRIPTSSIGARFMGDESIAAIAKDYELDQVEVVKALRFEMQRLFDAGSRAGVEATLARIEEHLVDIKNRVGA